MVTSEETQLLSAPGLAEGISTPPPSSAYTLSSASVSYGPNPHVSSFLREPVSGGPWRAQPPGAQSQVWARMGVEKAQQDSEQGPRPDPGDPLVGKALISAKGCTGRDSQ
jgi:hypothetical protein